MEYADLRVLEAVARHRSMNRAAAELHMVQSNVTARIQGLEEEVGTRLLERSSRGAVLTAAGERLVPYAAKLAALLHEAHAAAHDDGTPRGGLRLGSLETSAALRLPPILSAYAQAYPAVDLTVITGTTARLIEDVREHRLDGALVAGPVQHPDLDEEAIFHEELMVVTAPTIRHLSELGLQRNLRMVVFARGCSYRQRLETILACRGMQAVQSLEFGSLEAIMGCVAAGIGITLLPKSVAAPYRRDGHINTHELPPEQAAVDTVFIRRRETRETSALAAFLAMARPRSFEMAAAAE